MKPFSLPSFSLRSLPTVLAGLTVGVGLLAQGVPPSAPPVADEHEGIRLDRFDVTGARELDYAPTFSTGGTRTAASLAETPQAISVISRFQIADQAAQSMQEVLRYAPGVRAERYGLDNRGDWFALRGGSDGSTVLDGLRLPLTGWYGLVRNDPFAFERVEVLRGPTSVMFGQNGPGGLVNLVSKRPQARPHGEVTFQFGSFRHRQFAFDLGGPLAGHPSLLYRVVGVAKDSGTQIDYAEEERVFIAPSFTWRASARTTLTVAAEYQRDESGNTNAFLPFAGTLFPAPHGPIPDRLFIGEPAWDYYGGERARFSYHLEHRVPGGRWSIRHNARFDKVTGAHRTMYANFWEGLLPGDREVNRTWYATDNENRIVTTDLLAEGRFESGALRHTLLIGVDALWTRDAQGYLAGAGTPLDVYDPVYGTFALPALDFGTVTPTRTRQFGVLVQDQLRFAERWVATASLRGDRVQAGSQEDDALSTRLGLVYLARHGLAPYASYSESFEALAGTDVNGSPYDPKRGEQLEAGIKWARPDARIAAAAAVYTLKETGRLTTDPTNPANQIQRGEVTVNGAELEFTSRLGPWNLLANTTWTDAKVTASSDPDDPYLDHQLASIPEYSASLWAVHAFSSPALAGLRLGFGVRYVGASWDGTDTVRTPSNTLFDALLSYDVDRWHFALNATNLADKAHIVASLDRGDVWFGNRRKVVGTVSYRW